MTLSFGRIVWAEAADRNGIRKVRPVVIVTPTDQISDEILIDCVAVTSFLPDPLPDDHVLLPWHAQGHPRTGLNRRSAAVCSWQAHIAVDDIKNVGGVVPGPILLEIMAKVSSSPPP